MILLSLGAGCGTEDAAPRELEDAAEPAGRSSGPDLEAPPGQDPAAVQPHVADLLRNYDRVVNDIYADAAAVDDTDHHLLEELRALFAPDSEQVAFLVDAWVDEDGSGEEEEDAHFLRTELQSVEGESDDRVSFVTCVETRLFMPEDGSAGGRAVGYEFRAGHGQAVRTGDGWLLDEVSTGEAGLCTPAGS